MLMIIDQEQKNKDETTDAIVMEIEEAKTNWRSPILDEVWETN